MKELQIIEKREVLGKDFKIYGDYENPLFLAKDVAEWIEYDVSSVNKMLASVDASEKTTRKISPNGSNYQTEAWFLTEDGLYEVLMQSRKPIAKEFKKQVKEILKSVRKHGLYAKDELLNNPDLLLEVIQQLKAEREARKLAEEEKDTLEISLNTSLKFYTVAKYNKVFKMGWDMKKCQEIGKKMAVYCRSHAIEVRKCQTNDERFGEVNSYPLTAWEEVLSDIFTS